jgi:regulator of protease activity HflC (stomatin/prohibitin superfamily)
VTGVSEIPHPGAHLYWQKPSVPDAHWSAASWLFDWTVDFLSKATGDAAATDHLREIIDDNIGWLGLDDLPSDVRARLLERIKAELVDTADRTLPPTLTNRDAVLDLLRELVRLAERAS